MARTKGNKKKADSSVSILEEFNLLTNSNAENYTEEGMRVGYPDDDSMENENLEGIELSLEASESDLAMENQGDIDNEEFICRDDLEIVDHCGNLLRLRKGMTRPKDVWNLHSTERIKIHCNSFGQPVKIGGGILGGWLGSYARRASLCPVNYKNWRKMPKSLKTMLLKQTRKRFFLPQDSKIDAWIKKKTGKNWKNYRFKLKKQYVLEGSTEAQVANKRPPNGITRQQWTDLVSYWFGEDCQRYSAIGKAARATLSTPHTTGSKSYARVRDEHAQKKGKEPGRIEFFTITHTRKSGRLDDNAAKFVDDASNMVRNVSSAPGCSQSIVQIENQVYAQLMDKGTKVTGFGTGVTSEEVSEMQVDARNALPYGENQSEKDENFKLQMAEMKRQYDLGLAEMQNQYEDRISRMEAEHTAVQIEQASKYSTLQAQVDHLMNVMMTSAMPPN